MHPTASHRSPHRAFTLFEIAISMVILSVAVLGVALIFPIGIKAQQMARFKMFAGAQMVLMSEMFANPEHRFHECQYEAEKLGQSLATISTMDLERGRQSAFYNLLPILPLPDEIASRLDSDDDEMQRVLADGGKLYYINPRAPMSTDGKLHGTSGASAVAAWTDTDIKLASEQQKLVLAVVGYAQQDALRCHPCIGWPYHDFYPTPPTNSGDGANWPEQEDWQVNGWPCFAELVAVESASRCDLRSVASIQAYIDACRALVAAVGVTTTATAGGPVPQLPQPLASIAAPWSESDEQVFPKPYKVLAIRYLAHAAACRFSSSIATGQPAASEDEAAYARDCNDACMQWAHRYARANPYDWGAARIQQENIAFDYPLLQFDLFSPWVEIDDGSGDPLKDRSWKVASPVLPTGFGRARGNYGWNGLTPDNHGEIANSFGDARHFTLNNRFAAAERCRQVVFWAVDWQAYEDFESAPSVLFDARSHNFDSRGAYVTHQDEALGPERQLNFTDGTRTVVGIAHCAVRNLGDLNTLPELTVGNYGADRNGNEVYDRGCLPPHIRLKALTVARFNYYDKRILASLKF